ncbi:ferredoxin [Methanoregula formicica]|uniref:Ferredoxin n=1 Tax=Methanoregula formicica (strain DSM 22288 / NBRC 105244 / SMSP) TaxID=593750 RepID=L0HI95_METFS|nr:ferredoxin [Methanoregula formicica]AGB03740.1 ferredoxin [Methanoregula formicica SMSP]
MSIYRSTSVSCDSCRDACPGFFEQNPDDTFSQVVEKYRLGGNPGTGTPLSDLEACAQDAADLCPVQIITIDGS